VNWSLSELFAKKKALIVDPSLADEAGHHLNVTSALVNTLNDAGYETRTLAFRQFDVEAHPDLNASPVFLNRCYDAVSSVLEKPSRYDALVDKFSIELDHALSDCRETTVIFPTLTFMELPAIAEWIAAHPRPERLTVYFWLVFGPEFLVRSEDQVKIVREWYREGFAQLERAAEFGARIHPIVETAGLHEEWQRLTKLEIATIRLPSMVHLLKDQSLQQERSSITIGYGGDVRVGKGFELLPGVVEAVLEARSGLRFDIRVAIDEPETHKAEIDALTGAGSRVSFKTGSLSPTRFQRFLAECDLILLPYDPEIYVLRGSSICDEAEALGLPQVVPAGVSFSHKTITGGASFSFDEYTAKAIASAVIAAADDMARLQENAERMRHAVTNQNRQFLALMQQG